ncbi:MAG: hypothetical protein HFJ03_12620 [Lachnospira sp.]|jgi:hypothetical protein|nr:hypothetical protein [Lachnospira sp.]
MAQSSKNTSNESRQEKVMTKYDRKVAKRKAERAREIRNKKIAVSVALLLCIGLVIGIGTAVGVNLYKIYYSYIKVDGNPVSEIEFDFYYSLSKNSMLNQNVSSDMTYAQYLQSYMGYDMTKSDKKQKYSDNYTWYDYFANNGVTSLKQYKTLLKIADERGFEYTTAEEDYNEFIDQIKSEAESASMSFNAYYEEAFGKHASKSNTKAYVNDYLKAVAFRDSIDGELAATTEQVSAYYEEHKNDYDTVSYRYLDIKAADTDDVSVQAAKSSADNMLEKITDEHSFIELCPGYATDSASEYTDDESKSLVSNATYASCETDIAEWLFDASRENGDKTLIEHDHGDSVPKYTVLFYIDRTNKKEDSTTAIENTLLDQNYSELIKPYMEAITVDTNGRYVTIES